MVYRGGTGSGLRSGRDRKSRRCDAKVFAAAKDFTGRTAIRAQAAGDQPQAGALAGLFPDNLLAEFLDRIESIAIPVSLALIVEGFTDRRYIEMALETADRMDLLDAVTIIGRFPSAWSEPLMQAWP